MWQALDYNYVLWSIGLTKSSTYTEMTEWLFKNDYQNLFREINIWCFKYKIILNRISSEKLDKLSEWDHKLDKYLVPRKILVDKLISQTTTKILIVEKYFTEVPFVEWVDAYLRSDTKKYEPGQLKDAGTTISNELNRVIKKQSLEDEKDSLAFYDIRELGEGAFGVVRLLKTNSVIVGTEVKIAVKTIKSNSKI